MALSALAGVPGQGALAWAEYHFPMLRASKAAPRERSMLALRATSKSGGVLVDAVNKARARAPGFGVMPGDERIMNTEGAGAIGKHGNAGALV